MAYSVEVVSPVSRKISVTIPVEEVNAALNKAAKEIGASVTIPGFRKGKASAAVIEKRFPQDVISRASEVLIDKQVADIMEAEKLEALSRLSYDGNPITRNQELTFSVSFETMPEIELPEDLSAFSVDVASADLVEGDIEKYRNDLLKYMARVEEVTEDRQPVNGDIVTVNVDADIDGKPVPGMKVENYSIQLVEPKEDKELSELDTIIRSLKVGQEGNGNMVCPEDHIDQSLRGKTVELHVKLLKISKEILPDIDENFAKSAGFDSVENLNKSIEEQAKISKAKLVREEAQQKLLESVMEGKDFPLPESFLNKQKLETELEVREYLASQGMVEDAIEHSLKNMEQETQKQAEEHARVQLFLKALAKRENIQVSQQEVDLQLMRIAMQRGEDFKKVRDTYYQNGTFMLVHEKLLTSKALALMFDKAQKNTPATA